MVGSARHQPKSSDRRTRAFTRLPGLSRGALAARALTCVVAVSAAVCVSQPSAAADPVPGPVSFESHVDTSTDAGTDTTRANPWGVAVGDINGDGKADLVLPNLHRDEITVMVGGGDGTFTRSSSAIAAGPNAGAVALADFNGDGYLDIAAVNGGSGTATDGTAGNTVSVYLATSPGVFGARSSYPVGAQDVFNQSVAVIDLDHKNGADLIVADSGSDTISVLPNNGDGTFGAPTTATVGTQPQSVATEYNSVTGQLGIAVAAAGDNTVDVIPVGHDGTLGDAVGYAVGATPGSVTAAYLTNDEIADLVVGNYGDGTVSVLVGQADGTFANAVTYQTGQAGLSAPEGVTIANLNGDGFPDVAVANGDAAKNSDAGVTVLLGDGTGALSGQQDFTVGNGAIGIAAVDLDRDGLPELITANADDDTVSVLHNTTPASPADSSGSSGSSNSPALRGAVIGVTADSTVGDVGVVDLDADEFQRVANDDIRGIGPVLSPDVTKVAMWVPTAEDADPCGAKADLVVADLAGEARTSVASDLTMVCPTFMEGAAPGQSQLGLAWAPDGSLYYDDPADASIHRVGADGSGDTKVVDVPRDADGDALAYPVADAADGSLWVALPDGGRSRKPAS